MVMSGVQFYNSSLRLSFIFRVLYLFFSTILLQQKNVIGKLFAVAGFDIRRYCTCCPELDVIAAMETLIFLGWKDLFALLYVVYLLSF